VLAGAAHGRHGEGTLEKLVLYVPGDPERAFDEFQVAAKFWRLTGRSSASTGPRSCFAAATPLWTRRTAEGADRSDRALHRVAELDD